MTASSDASARPAHRHLVYVVALGLLATISTLTIDIYLPAFPAIAHELAASETQLQLTFAGAMMGMIAGKLLIGPSSDVVGRRRLLLFAILAHVLASVACALAPTIEMLIIARVLQGAASAATGVLSLAMVRDLYSGLRMVRMLASLAVISGAAIAVGPLLGAQLLLIMNWRGVFITLAVYGLLIGLLIFLGTKESLPDHLRHRGRMQIVAHFRAVLSDRLYVGLMLTGAFMWAGMYNYLSSSSFVFQRLFELSAIEYGYVFATHAIFMLLGNQVGSRLARKLAPQWIIAISSSGAVLASAALVIVGLGPDPSLLSVVIPLWCFTFALGATNPCLQALAMSRRSKEAGTAAALLGAAQQVLAVISTPLAGIIGITSILPVMGVLLGCQLLAVVCFWLIFRPVSFTKKGDIWGLPPEPALEDVPAS